MRDYSKGVIYTIKCDSGIYVGSSTNFSKRKADHKYIIKHKLMLDRLIYKSIRKHLGVCTIEIYKMFPCKNKNELIAEEQRIMKELNANLNTYECQITYINNRIVCECGANVRRDNIIRHRKSDKHISFLINESQMEEESELLKCKLNKNNNVESIAKDFLDIAGNIIDDMDKKKQIREIKIKKNVIISETPSIIEIDTPYPSSDTESESEYESNTY